MNYSRYTLVSWRESQMKCHDTNEYHYHILKEQSKFRGCPELFGKKEGIEPTTLQ